MADVVNLALRYQQLHVDTVFMFNFHNRILPTNFILFSRMLIRHVIIIQDYFQITPNLSRN